MSESVLRRWGNLAKKEREGVYKSSALRADICIQRWMWTIIFTVFLFQILYLVWGIGITYQCHQLKFNFSGDKACLRKIFLFILRLLGLFFYCISRLNIVSHVAGLLLLIIRGRGMYMSFYKGSPWCHFSKNM